jgi:hypothetical protein
VLGDDVEGEVVADEGDLDDRDAGRDEAEEEVDGAAGEVDAAVVAVASREG